MDFFSRLVGGTYGQPRVTTKAATNNGPQARLARFKRVFNLILELCNKPRDPTNEGPLLDQLRKSIDRLVTLVREETRASVPHLCLQYAATSQLYTVVGRAAIVSQYEPVIHAAVALFAALVDSEEEDFLSSSSFAKSLMRLVTRVVANGDVLISVESETSILELLFTISAKIRLQPEILSVWFRLTARPEQEDVFVKEKRSFVGITQKDDFPLCYLLIDRVHHDGRIGDFARTGLLYIFEATGRSVNLEEWVISSDLPTLMASGLGALYSQLSRELSILHPDATLPAVLAMSDYSTTHTRAAAESAFSERHQAHMATFLSYLAFWQDVLDHCRSADVKQTLLDHFQILFLQQLLYPSLLQSSDTDAGSAVAVLTYMTCILDALDYPDLLHMMLTYLLAIPESGIGAIVSSKPATPVRPAMPPRSPTTLRRRQSLMLLTAPKDPDEALEPTLFNLTDLTLNSIRSKGPQTAFAALRLTSTMLSRQPKYAFGTLLKIRPFGDLRSTPQRSTLAAGDCLVVDTMTPTASNGHRLGTRRTVGALELEVDEYSALATDLYGGIFPEPAYATLCEDVRYCIEAQAPANLPGDQYANGSEAGTYTISPEDPLLRSLTGLLRTFLSNSVDVNLALTQALISIATCVELRLDTWFALDPSRYAFSDGPTTESAPWQAYLDPEEAASWFALQQASRHPVWPGDDATAPRLFIAIKALVEEIAMGRARVPNMDQLLVGRQHMLQASIEPEESVLIEPSSFLDVPGPTAGGGHSRSSSVSSYQAAKTRGRQVDAHRAMSPLSRTQATSPSPSFVRPSDTHSSISPASSRRPIHQPPPPDTDGETPSTTDVLMRKITFPAGEGQETEGERSASLNHVLTNIVVLQQFVLELVAVLQVRAAVLGEREVFFG